MADNWAQQWKNAKKSFEDKTNRSKPGIPFLLFFKKGTGIGKALEDCEKAHQNLHSLRLIVAGNPHTPVTSIETDAVQGFTKAVLAFKPKASAYVTGVNKSLANDTLKDKIKGPTTDLLNALQGIGKSLDDEIKFWVTRH